MTRASAVLLAVLAAGAGACLRSTTFECGQDSECVFGEQGTCEDVGYCSFPDPGCDSGRRFGDGAGEYAGACVGESTDARVDAPATDGRPIDAPTDGSIDAPVSVGCVDPGNGTTFPNGQPCNNWGSMFNSNAQVQNAGGRLTVTPAANMVTFGGCVHAAVPFDAPGVFVELERVVDGASARTRLELAGTGVTLGVEGGMLVARAADVVIASAPFSVVSMRWWRMRPAGAGVRYETSSDGMTWTLFASSATGAPAMAPIRVVGETTAGEPAPGTARFAGVNLCP